MQAPVALTNEGVAGVGAHGNRRQGKARVERGGKILERMDGEIDLAHGKRVFDLLDEDALGVERGAVGKGGRSNEAGVLHAIPNRADDFDLNRVAAFTKLRGDMVCLPERELRAARAYSNGGYSHRSRIRRISAVEYDTYMRVILFGGTGMVGQGVLRQCIEDAEVERVLLVVRKTTGLASGKVEELVHNNFFDWTGAEEHFDGYDTCFFCLGVSSVGMSAASYSRITYDLTLSVAEMLISRGSLKTFVYVSGSGTDSTEKGRSMWARVKGATENALMRLPLPNVFCFRPGYIQPLHGIRSKVGWYNAIYTTLSWTYPLLRRVAAGLVTSTEELGCAMIGVARSGYPKKILETRDIQAAALQR